MFLREIGFIYGIWGFVLQMKRVESKKYAKANHRLKKVHAENYLIGLVL